MPLYFCFLALNAGFSPIANVDVNFWPNENPGDEFLRSLHSRMCQTMQKIKHLSAEGNRDKRSGCASGGVH